MTKKHTKTDFALMGYVSGLKMAINAAFGMIDHARTLGVNEKELCILGVMHDLLVEKHNDAFDARPSIRGEMPQELLAMHDMVVSADHSTV